MVAEDERSMDRVAGGRPYRGLSERERRDERRARLTAAALELFSTEGYARTPIERICEVSHVTTRHFYELFPSKKRLLAAVLEEVMDHARSAVTRALATPVLDPVERGRAGISAFVHSYLDDPRHARIVLVEVVGVSPHDQRAPRRLDQHRKPVAHRRDNQRAGAAASKPTRAQNGVMSSLFVRFA